MESDSKFVKDLTKNSVVLTESGMVRLRWWPVMATALYLSYNAMTFALVGFGFAKGWHADPVLHAPIYFLFGS